MEEEEAKKCQMPHHQGNDSTPDLYAQITNPPTKLEFRSSSCLATDMPNKKLSCDRPSERFLARLSWALPRLLPGPNFFRFGTRRFGGPKKDVAENSFTKAMMDIPILCEFIAGNPASEGHTKIFMVRKGTQVFHRMSHPIL